MASTPIIAGRELPTLFRWRRSLKPHTFQVTDSAGVAVDITGWTIVVTVGTERGPTDNTTDIITMDVTLTVPASGTFTAEPTDIAEADQPEGSYYYGVQYDDTTGIDNFGTGVYLIANPLPAIP